MKPVFNNLRLAALQDIIRSTWIITVVAGAIMVLANTGQALGQNNRVLYSLPSEEKVPLIHPSVAEPAISREEFLFELDVDELEARIKERRAERRRFFNTLERRNGLQPQTPIRVDGKFSDF